MGTSRRRKHECGGYKLATEPSALPWCVESRVEYVPERLYKISTVTTSSTLEKPKTGVQIRVQQKRVVLLLLDIPPPDMSDSELSDAPSQINVPSDSVITTTLQNQVAHAAQGPIEDYTVSKIRKAAENKLGLPDGFFKGDEKWKARSKTIIEEQVAKENERNEEDNGEKTAADLGSALNKGRKAGSKPERALKRAPPETKSRPNKRVKVDSDQETSALSSPPSDIEEDGDKKTGSTKRNGQYKATKSQLDAKSKPKARPSDADKDNNSADSDDGGENQGDGSESEMSVVLDEAPSQKRRSKSKSTGADTSATKGKSAKPTPKSKSKAATETDPDQEEIKKLQGWLVKCGIRKVWGKELKPYETTKAKIKHLREMLSDAGMTGRYSNEKAAQIKEARELAADIEAVQEGNERWGKSDEDGDDNDGDGADRTRGGRRLVRGAMNYDFLSSDGEETD